MQNLLRLSLYRAMDFYSNRIKHAFKWSSKDVHLSAVGLLVQWMRNSQPYWSMTNTLMELIDMILLPFVDILLHLGDGVSFFFYLKSLS